MRGVLTWWPDILNEKKKRITKASQLVEESRMVGKNGREINSDVFILHTSNCNLKRQNHQPGPDKHIVVCGFDNISFFLYEINRGASICLEPSLSVSGAKLQRYHPGLHRQATYWPTNGTWTSKVSEAALFLLRALGRTSNTTLRILSVRGVPPSPLRTKFRKKKVTDLGGNP